MLTALDQVANQNHLQLVKALLPYLPPDKQKPLSVLIKMTELQNVLRFYAHNDRCMSACNTSGEPAGMLDILADLRNYCDEPEQAMIDQCIQLMSTMELYAAFMQSEQDLSGFAETTSTREGGENDERRVLDEQPGPERY